MYDKENFDLEVKKTLDAFAKNFKEARSRACLSQRDITNIIDIPQNYISKIEASKANPTFETLVKLSISVGVELHILLEK